MWPVAARQLWYLMSAVLCNAVVCALRLASVRILKHKHLAQHQRCVCQPPSVPRWRDLLDEQPRDGLSTRCKRQHLHRTTRLCAGFQVRKALEAIDQRA